MSQDVRSLRARAAQFFFMWIGSLVAVVAYFTLYGGSGYSAGGLRTALLVALGLQSAYVALAWWQDYLSQLDRGFWLLFALGAAAILAGITPLVGLYQLYSPALVFAMLGLTAVLPPLFGYDWFTATFMRRMLPRWQQKQAVTARIGAVVGMFWAALFFVAAALCAYAPLDWRFTTLYPNLLIFGVGLTANRWLPALYLKLFPPPPPSTAEAAIMGMPFVFDQRAARDARTEIQFRVSGAEPGNYWLRIADGRCASFEGDAPAASLTLHTSDTVWMRIVRGEVEGAQALAAGLFRAEGDAAILAALGTWFPRRP